MADKVTTTNTLGVGIEYPDAEKGTIKTAYLKIPNPKIGLTESQIKNAVGNLLTAEILKDIHGNVISTTAIATAYTETQEVVDLDIGVE